MSEQTWCPLQARIVLAYRGWRPYVEPLRALPLPQKLYGAISRHSRWMYCSPTRSTVTDRVESMLVRAIDSADGMRDTDKATHEALRCLDVQGRAIVNALASCAGSDCQFDFSGAAQAWTTAKRGRCPDRGGKEKACAQYDAWMRALSRRRAFYLGEWSRVEETLKGLLVACSEDTA